MKLYQEHLTNIKPTSNGWYIASCPNPNHPDTNPSFSFHREGNSKCLGNCNWGGTEYDVAMLMNLPNAKEYLRDESGNYIDISKPNGSLKKITTNKPKTNLIELKAKNRANLEANMELFPEYWDKRLIKQFIGLNDYGQWTFNEYDSNNNLINVRDHKGRQYGSDVYKKNKWLPLQSINYFDRTQPLYWLEGHPDLATLLSDNKQSITTSCGSMNIPKNEDGSLMLDFFKGWESNIYLCGDNDDAGRNGNIEAYHSLLEFDCSLDVSIINWGSNRANKYDVTDAFKEDRLIFYNAIEKATKPKRQQTMIGGLQVIETKFARTREIIPREQIVDKVLIEGAKNIIAGTTGSNKSYYALQLAISIANDEDYFMSFKVNKKGLKVLFVDTEIGEEELSNRFQQLLPNFDWKDDSRICLISKVDKTPAIYDNIETAVKMFKPDVLIVDCLYNTSPTSDFSQSRNISKITERLDDVIRISPKKLTLLCVHHFTKGNHEQGLTMERMVGGNSLQNWLEHLVLLSRTNQPHLRLLKVAKSRHTNQPDTYYIADWDSDNFLLNNRGITADYHKLLLSEKKMKSWESIINGIQGTTFTTQEFKVDAIHKAQVSERTSQEWLKEMVQCGAIEKLSRGNYKKCIEVIDVENM